MNILANLHLDNYYVTKFFVNYTSTFFVAGKEKEIKKLIEEAPIFVDFKIRPDDEDKRYTVLYEFHFGMDEIPRPIQYHIEMFGFFHFSENATQEEIKKLLPLNPVVMLHGVARGILGQIMAHGPMNDYILPSINFYEVLKQKSADNSIPENEPDNKQVTTKKARFKMKEIIH